MEEKNYTLLSAEELAELLRAGEGSADALDEIEGELIKRIKNGECDVSILDGINLPSMQESEDSEPVKAKNPFILPGAYAFPSVVSLVVMLLAFVNGALTLYALVSGGYFTDVMSVLYYGFSAVLVEFGKFFLIGLGIHLLTDIAYNTFKKSK